MRKLKNTKGITLIALVITIIVLLILAGVTIASLTGNNGLLNRAANAKDATEAARQKEEIQMAVLASIGLDGKIDVGMLADNLSKISGITYNNSRLSNSNKITSLPAEVKINENKYEIDEDGNTEEVKPHVYSAEVTEKLKIDTTQIDDYKISPYIRYNGELYRILYDMDSGYDWIEIISVNPIDTVTLGRTDPELPTNTELENQGYGTSDFEKSRWSYNNAITTLNKKATAMLNTTYSSIADRVRCVGSDPKYPAKDVTELGYAVTDEAVNAYIKAKGYNNKFKVEDTNYTRGNDTTKLMKDWDQLDVIKSRNIEEGYYWLATRMVDATSFATDFVLRFGYNSTYLGSGLISRVGSYGSATYSAHGSEGNYGFRPVIRLKSGVKISNPDAAGTSTDPFELSMQ